MKIFFLKKHKTHRNKIEKKKEKNIKRQEIHFQALKTEKYRNKTHNRKQKIKGK